MFPLIACAPPRASEYRVWLTEDKQSMVALVLPGSSLVGHPRITHGGCTAAVADNLFGTLFFVAARGAMGFTANQIGRAHV